MIVRRAVVSLSAAALLAAAATGCGPGGSGTGASATTSDSTATHSSAPHSSAPPTDAAGLADWMRAGAASIHTAHVAMNVSAVGATITATGDETLDNGQVQAMDLTEEIPNAGQLRLVVAGGKTYAQLPPQLNQSGKPWTLVTTSSSNPAVQAMAQAMQSFQQSASLAQYSALTQAAAITLVDPHEQVGGTTAAHYKLDVDVLKMPNDLPQRTQLLSAGVTRLPVELWVDQRGRPVKVTDQVETQGQQASTEVTVGNFDAPVTIAPPDPSQVAG